MEGKITITATIKDGVLIEASLVCNDELDTYYLKDAIRVLLDTKKEEANN